MGVTRASLSRLRLPIPPLRPGNKYSQIQEYVKRKRLSRCDFAVCSGCLRNETLCETFVVLALRIIQQ